MNLDTIRLRVRGQLLAAGYTEREITLAVERIAAEAVDAAFDGDAVAIVSDRLLADRLAAAREAHERAVGRVEKRGKVVEIGRGVA